MQHFAPMSLAGFWTIALLIACNANVGEGQFDDPVPFPPARPTVLNIYAICHYGNGRRTYPASSIPLTWSSSSRRRATAINRLESWYQQCCIHGLQIVFCCVQQAWDQALAHFCKDEFSTKTAAYGCCRLRGQERWKCFSTEPANPSYNPLPGYRAPIVKEQGFVFSIHECLLVNIHHYTNNTCI